MHAQIPQSLAKNAIWAIVWACGLFLMPGCQTDAINPWMTESYRDPSEYRQVPHSTYAPMPSILPSIDGTSTGEKFEPGGEDELEQVLNELDIH